MRARLTEIDDHAGQAERRNVDEIAGGRFAGFCKTSHPADIDRTDAGTLQPLDRYFRSGFDAEGLAKVAARSARDKGEHGVLRCRSVGIEHAVDSFVDRAVAADSDDLLMSFAKRIAHKSRGFALLAREADGHGGIDDTERALDGFPLAAGAAVAGVRIDDYERGHAASRV